MYSLILPRAIAWCLERGKNAHYVVTITSSIFPPQNAFKTAAVHTLLLLVLHNDRTQVIAALLVVLAVRSITRKLIEQTISTIHIKLQQMHRSHQYGQFLLFQQRQNAAFSVISSMSIMSTTFPSFKRILLLTFLLTRRPGHEAAGQNAR